MGGLAKGVSGVFKSVSKFVKPLVPLIDAASGIMGIAGMISSTKSGGGDDSAAIAAYRRQEELNKAQAAAQQRMTIQADAREAELSSQLSNQRRALVARRSGTGGLSFSGNAGNLKSQLGG